MEKVLHQKVEKVLHQQQNQQNQRQNQENQENQENKKQSEPTTGNNVDDCQGMIAAKHLVGILKAGGLPEGELLQQKTM